LTVKSIESLQFGSNFRYLIAGAGIALIKEPHRRSADRSPETFGKLHLILPQLVTCRQLNDQKDEKHYRCRAHKHNDFTGKHLPEFNGGGIPA